jgi:hypothetical protein
MTDAQQEQQPNKPLSPETTVAVAAGKQMSITVGFLVAVLGAQLYLLDRFSKLEVAGAVQATELSAVKATTTDIKERIGRLEGEIHALPTPPDPHTIARIELTLAEIVQRVEVLEALGAK